MEKIIIFNNTVIVINNEEIINCKECKKLEGSSMELCSKHFLAINRGKIKVFPQYDIRKKYRGYNERKSKIEKKNTGV